MYRLVNSALNSKVSDEPTEDQCCPKQSVNSGILIFNYATLMFRNLLKTA